MREHFGKNSIALVRQQNTFFSPLMKVKWYIGAWRLRITQRTNEMKSREKMKDNDQMKTLIEGTSETRTV